jgi:hypothetical protein
MNHGLRGERADTSASSSWKDSECVKEPTHSGDTRNDFCERSDAICRETVNRPGCSNSELIYVSRIIYSTIQLFTFMFRQSAEYDAYPPRLLAPRKSASARLV